MEHKQKMESQGTDKNKKMKEKLENKSETSFTVQQKWNLELFYGNSQQTRVQHEGMTCYIRALNVFVTFELIYAYLTELFHTLTAKERNSLPSASQWLYNSFGPTKV